MLQTARRFKICVSHQDRHTLYVQNYALAEYLMKLPNFIALTFLIGLMSGCQAPTLQETVGPLKVEVVPTAKGFVLLRDGAPYRVNGAGMANAEGSLSDRELESLARHGGNSIRTWAVDVPGVPGQYILDKAYDLGITVALCLNIERERHGFDYNDPMLVAQQKEAARQIVEKYKDHPALLAWVIGNELNYDYTNPAVYDAVNDIALMIHKLDPNHPATTTTAGISASLIQDISSRAPALNFLSVQLYGDLVNLPSYVKEIGYTGAYFVTEWGSIGHWEMPQTSWGAPVELTSSAKADNFLKGYREVIEPFPHHVLGSYIFLWGQKQERTPTWYGMFTEDNLETETVDVMHFIWNGVWPDNRSPRLINLRLNAKTAMDSLMIAAGGRYTAEVQAVDPDGDSLSYAWSIKPESQATAHGGDKEESLEDLAGLFDVANSAAVELKAPKEPGAYRLFVYVYDGQGHAAHANLPFYVEEK